MKNKKNTFKQFKKCSVMIICLFIIVAFSSCNTNNLVGEWYNTDNLEDVLILTEDESFSVNNIGGTYAEQEEKLILTANYGESEVMEISRIDSYDCLIEDNGDIWIKGYDDAAAYHDKMKTQTGAKNEKYIETETLEKYVNNNSDVQAQINSLSTDNMTVDVVDNTLTYTYTYSQIIDEAAVSDISLELEHAMASAETQFKDIRNTLEEESGIDGITVKVVYEDSVGTVLYSKEF